AALSMFGDSPIQGGQWWWDVDQPPTPWALLAAAAVHHTNTRTSGKFIPDQSYLLVEVSNHRTRTPGRNTAPATAKASASIEVTMQPKTFDLDSFTSTSINPYNLGLRRNDGRRPHGLERRSQGEPRSPHGPHREGT